MPAIRATRGTAKALAVLAIDDDGSAILSRAQVRALEAATGEDDAYWAAPVSVPYRADTYRIPGPWVAVLTVPDEGQWAGETYADHGAFLHAHAAAYARGDIDATAYAEHYSAAYGRTPLEDCPPHDAEWPRWAARRDGGQ